MLFECKFLYECFGCGEVRSIECCFENGFLFFWEKKEGGIGVNARGEWEEMGVINEHFKERCQYVGEEVEGWEGLSGYPRSS